MARPNRPRPAAAPAVGKHWQDLGLLGLTVAIAGLSALDAGFTLLLLDAGAAVELNPLMRILIEHDVRLFVGVKSLVTSAGLILIAAAAKLNHYPASRLHAVLQVICAGYVTLIAYEAYLIRDI